MATTLLEDLHLDLEPVHFGPTWAVNPDFDADDPDSHRFLLPEITLGWQVLRWIEDNLLDDEGGPFVPTAEQSRFILWWYAIDERGRFAYRKGVLQRLKGWGKDPLATVLSAVEFVGPCRFAGWATVDMPDLELEAGDPVGKRRTRSWVQVAAVSQEQTKNTMTLFQGLFTAACVKEHAIDLGKTVIYAYGGQCRIESVTSSPRTMEGNRPTFVIKNETHHWLSNNEGHAMSAVIERNLTKSKDGSARSLSITNAYEPSEDSVAQREREAWEKEDAGLTIKTGVMYDSLEAAPSAKLRPPKKRDPETGERLEPTEAEVKAYLSAIIAAVRGDASWLDVEGLVASILSGENPPSQSRRFWFNQVVAAEDAWADPAAVDAAVDAMIAAYRREPDVDQLRVGWDLVMPDEEVAMFFDGSKSDDSTVLVGCRLSDDYVFTIGVWQKPPGERGAKWLAPREDVDIRVKEAFTRFNITAFWGDPSHALDDEDSSRYWDGMLDKWMREYKDRLHTKAWPVKTGNASHAIMFDMTSPQRQAMFVAAAEKFIEELEHLDDVEEFEPQFAIDGHPALVQHLKNAKRYPTKWGVSLMKDHRESPNKIDLAVAAVGAKMLARIVLNVGLEEEESPPAEIWGAW